MKVLIVNFSDTDGGAARASYRLHQALLDQGVDSNMFVQFKKSDDNTIISSTSFYAKIRSKLQAIANIIPLIKYKRPPLFSASFSPSFNIAEKINKLQADIVHLHWINAGMVKIEELSKIKAPIVWSLHDMWAFTGGCHYSGTCEKYKISCGECPLLRSNIENDLSSKIFKRKQKVFKSINITVVGLSRWLQECAKSSTLFKGKKVVNIPNPINTQIYKPFDKEQTRELFKLPKDRKLVLFGSMSATSDPRKGFHELKSSLRHLGSENVELLVYGSSEPETPQDLGFKTHYLGKFHDDKSLALLYSLADVMVVPSIEENLSNVIMESLSCATPVVCFDIGGNSDMVEHKINGYLVKPFDAKDLARGIDWVLYNEKYIELCESSRVKVLEKFENSIVAKEYIGLYSSILKE